MMETTSRREEIYIVKMHYLECGTSYMYAFKDSILLEKYLFQLRKEYRDIKGTNNWKIDFIGVGELLPGDSILGLNERHNEEYHKNALMFSDIVYYRNEQEIMEFLEYIGHIDLDDLEQQGVNIDEFMVSKG